MPARYVMLHTCTMALHMQPKPRGYEITLLILVDFHFISFAALHAASGGGR
jgi:hypothetical protein